jgi:hypothetical protein
VLLGSGKGQWPPCYQLGSSLAGSLSRCSSLRAAAAAARRARRSPTPICKAHVQTTRAWRRRHGGPPHTERATNTKTSLGNPGILTCERSPQIRSAMSNSQCVRIILLGEGVIGGWNKRDYIRINSLCLSRTASPIPIP